MSPKNETDDTKESEPNNAPPTVIDSKEDINKINSIKSEEKHDVIAHYTRDGSESPVERVKFQGIDDNDSICSDESDRRLPPIPDGGWGWVVVISAFIVSACADGLAFSFGLLHEEFARYFETTQSKTSLIGSLFIATPLLAGPIMSALVDRYGCRTMTIIAGIMSTIGFLLASVSDSVAMLCLTFGFFSGLAMGIFYVTAVVSVAFWFDKKRNLAVSLASCGIGFGTIVYSPLTEYFLRIYDWRNTIVLLAGTLLNMCVCGALMRNPEWLKIKQKRERQLSRAASRRSSSAGSVSSRSVGGESMFLSTEELRSLLKSGKSPEYILATLANNIAEAEQLEATTQMNAELNYKRMHSAIHLPTFIQQNEQVPMEVIEKLMENKNLYNIILQNYPEILTRRHSDVNLNAENPVSEAVNEPAKLPVELKVKVKKTKKASESESVGENKLLDEKKETKSKDNLKSSKPNVNGNDANTKAKQMIPKMTKTAAQQSWFRQFSTDHHYLRDMTLYKNTMMHRGAMMSLPRYKLKASSLPDMYKNSSWSLDSESDDEMKWYDHLWQVTKKTFDFRMYTEFHFLMFNLSSLILSVWFIVPYFFLNSYMTANKIDGGALMISIIGVASSIGIVVLGWAGDQPWINVTKTYACCLMICGLSVVAYPLFITNYWVLAVISTVFGLTFASSYSYIPAILMELMPIDHFTISYGLILMSEGIGHLVGPPIAGLLYDLTGTWELTFYMGGFWLIVSGICVGIIPYTKNVRICGTALLLKDIERSEKTSEAEDV